MNKLLQLMMDLGDVSHKALVNLPKAQGGYNFPKVKGKVLPAFQQRLQDLEKTMKKTPLPKPMVRTLPLETIDARKKAFNTIRPSSYDDINNYARFYSNTQRTEFEDPRSEEAFKLYLGLENNPQYFKKSKYKPTINATPGETYFSADPEMEQDIFNAYSKELKLNERRSVDESSVPSYFSEDTPGLFEEAGNQWVANVPGDKNLISGRPYNSRTHALGQFTVSRGKDEKGDYISYYDQYDFPESMQKRMKGEPYKIYNRVYYPKKQQGGPIIEDNMGQWNHPGKNTRIRSSNITMDGVPYPVLAKASNGMTKMMQPGQDYYFPGAEYVDEYPMMQFGGSGMLRTLGDYENFVNVVGEIMSAPQKALTALVSGKFQKPSEALEIKNKAGSFLTDLALDPLLFLAASKGSTVKGSAVKGAPIENFLKEVNPSLFIKRKPGTAVTDAAEKALAEQYLKEVITDPNKQALYSKYGPTQQKYAGISNNDLGLNPTREGGRQIRTQDSGSGLFKQNADTFGNGYNLFDLLNNTGYHLRKNKFGGSLPSYQINGQVGTSPDELDSRWNKYIPASAQEVTIPFRPEEDYTEPVTQIEQTAQKDAYTGPSIVDYLATRGYDGNKAFRKALADQYDVKDYDFSPKKNLELLAKIRENDDLLEASKQNFTPVSVEQIERSSKQNRTSPITNAVKQDIEAEKRQAFDSLRRRMTLELGYDPYLEGPKKPTLNSPNLSLSSKSPYGKNSLVNGLQGTGRQAQPPAVKASTPQQQPRVVPPAKPNGKPLVLPPDKSWQPLGWDPYLQQPAAPASNRDVVLPTYTPPTYQKRYPEPASDKTEDTEVWTQAQQDKYWEEINALQKAEAYKDSVEQAYADSMWRDFDVQFAKAKQKTTAKAAAKNLEKIASDENSTTSVNPLGIPGFSMDQVKEAYEYVSGLFGGVQRKIESMQDEDKRSISKVNTSTIDPAPKAPPVVVGKKGKKQQVVQPTVPFGYKQLYAVPDVKNPKDSLVSFVHTFDNEEGGRYYIGHKAKEVTDAGAQRKFKNAQGVAHFLRDSDILPGQKITPESWNVSKGYTYHTTSPGKTVSAAGFDDPERYRMLYKPNPKNDGTYLAKYVKNKDISPVREAQLRQEGWGVDFTVNAQHKFTDIDWDGEGPSTGYASKSKWLPLKNGKHTYIPYKSKDGFSRFSGGSGVFLFKDPRTGKKVGVDASGSVNTIRKIGEDAIKTYGVKPEDVEFAYHDMGSYSAKPKAHGDELDYRQWLDYNSYNRGFSGAPMIIPKNKYGGSLPSYQIKGQVSRAAADNTNVVVPINVLPTMAEHKYTKDQFDKAKQFHEKWMSSPMYNKMIQKSDPEYAEEITERRRNNIKDIKFEYSPFQPADSPDMGGYSRGATGDITVLPRGFGVRGMGTHEVSHSGDRATEATFLEILKGMGSLLTGQDEDNKYLYSRSIPVTDIGLIRGIAKRNSKQWLNADNDDRKWFNYVTKPTETRARLNDIRQQASEHNLYDPFNQPVTPKIYEKLKGFQFDKGKNKGFDALMQLRSVYGDNQIIDLLNSVSKTDSEIGLDQAEYGGGLLSKTVSCSNCGHSWRAVDGGADVMSCHKCGGIVKMKQGGQMIRRADGSYSQRGLWDNIRANKGSGKKPTKQMLEQERKIKKAQWGLEFKMDNWLGKPMEKAEMMADKFTKPGEDQTDNFRHPMAGRYASEAIQRKTGNIPVISNILGFIGGSAAGLGHELLDPNRGPDKNPYTLGQTIREGAEDQFNNMVGALIGSLPFMSATKKTQTLKYLSDNNLIPDGYGRNSDNMYFKKMGGKVPKTFNGKQPLEKKHNIKVNYK